MVSLVPKRYCLMQSVVVLFPLWNESSRTRLQPQCLPLLFESIGSALAVTLVAGGCNKVVFFVWTTDSNSKVSQHFLLFVGSTSNLYISSSISSLICVSLVLCGFPNFSLGFNLHQHQSTPRHPLQVACSNEAGRRCVSWRGYMRRILRTVHKILFHSLLVFPWCLVCWTFANRFRTPNPRPHVWLWFRR